MAHPEGSNPRQKKPQENRTQFDIDLIKAARDKKDVELYFSVEEIAEEAPSFVGKVEVVDRYMLKISDVAQSIRAIWIQKHLLAGVRVR